MAQWHYPVLEGLQNKRTCITQASTLSSLFFFCPVILIYACAVVHFFDFTSKGSEVTHWCLTERRFSGTLCISRYSVSSHSPKTCRRATRAGCSPPFGRQLAGSSRSSGPQTGAGSGLGTPIFIFQWWILSTSTMTNHLERKYWWSRSHSWTHTAVCVSRDICSKITPGSVFRSYRRCGCTALWTKSALNQPWGCKCH